MKTVLCFGDSNTYGLIPGTTDRYGWGVRWTSILDENIREYGYRVAEEGLCGRTSIFTDPLRDGRRGADVLPFILETHSPIDTIVIMLGTNDCKVMYDASAELIGKGIERLIRQVREKQPYAKIILVSPITLGDGVWEEEFDLEFNERSVAISKQLKYVYKRLADKMGIQFLAASDYASPSEKDREHMDEEGHKGLAEAMTKAVLAAESQDCYFI